MVSEPLPRQAESEADLQRFDAGRDAARDAVSDLIQHATGYLDAFVQQSVLSTLEGSVRVAGRAIPPIDVRSSVYSLEGMALRRLDDRHDFAAADGLGADTAAHLVRKLSASAWEITEPTKAVRPRAEEDMQEASVYVRSVADAILSLLPTCREVKIHVADLHERRAVVNSLGFDHSQKQSRTELRVEVKTDKESVGVTRVDLALRATGAADPGTVAREIETAILGRGGTHVAPPEGAPLLLPPGWGGVWMHEAVGHLLEADTQWGTRAGWRDLRGQRCAIEALNIVDDGTCDHSRVPFKYDDEGVATRKTQLVRGGIVVGLLSDRVTAAGANLPLTGNGRRPHFGLPPRPRMTNLLLGPGNLSREQLLATEGTVIVADSITHAWLNLHEGRLFLDIEAASLVRNGEHQAPLGRLLASAEPLVLLGNIIGVADDFAVDLDRGYCMKDGAAVPVTVGQPSVLSHGWHIRSVAR